MADLHAATSTYETGTNDTYTSVTDFVDFVLDIHQNGPASAIVAIQTILGTGTGLKGSVADLDTRLAVNLEANGKLKDFSATTKTTFPPTTAEGCLGAVTANFAASELIRKHATLEKMETTGYTLPAASGVVCDLATDQAITGVKTMTSPVLTTPVIGLFTNATHTHEDAAGGGKLGQGVVESTETNFDTASYNGNVPTTEVFALQDFGFWPPAITHLDVNRGNTTVVPYHVKTSQTATRNALFSDDGAGNGPAGTCRITYRYWTASENPMTWISYDASGTIQNIWEAEDPPGGEASRSTCPFALAPGLVGVEVTDFLLSRPFLASLKSQVETRNHGAIMDNLKAQYAKRGMYTPAELEGLDDIEELRNDRTLSDGQRIWRIQMWLRYAAQSVSGQEPAIADILKARYKYNSASRQFESR